MTDKKAKRVLSPLAKAKAAFRQSKTWKEFRKSIMLSQKGLDPLTRRKVLKRANLHHRLINLQDIEKYKDISNPDNFVLLNKEQHEIVHRILRYVTSCGYEYWQRLQKEIELEIEMNDLS